METKLEPKGVEGWLLLLCFVLIIGGPMMTVLGIVDTYKSIQGNNLLFDKHPGLYSILRADIILSSIVTYFSINAGWSLYTIKAGAIKKVKTYFLIAIAYRIAAYFLPFSLQDLPKEYMDSISNEIFKDTIKPMISISAWYLYIIKSKRVKNTYSAL